MLHTTALARGASKFVKVEKPGAPYPDFQALLGTHAWRALPEAVRARFDGTHGKFAEKIYAGVMTEVRASRIGLWLAKLCVLVGTPVVPLTGRNVPVFVRLFHVAKSAGIAWERLYRFKDHPTIAVRSTKMLNPGGQLIESLGLGLCMPLALAEVRGELHFISQGYYFQWGRLRVPLPHWFPPGKTTVIHRDLGHGRFRFTLQTSHPWFGEMFYQEGVFIDGEQL